MTKSLRPKIYTLRLYKDTSSNFTALNKRKPIVLHIILKRSSFQTKCSKKFFNWAHRSQLGPIADLGAMGRPLRFFLNSPQTLSLANSKIWLKKPTRRLKGKGPYCAPKDPKSPITTLNARNPIVLHIILKRSIFQTKCPRSNSRSNDGVADNVSK